MTYRGLHTAIVTPFDNENNIDFKALEKLMQQQINAQVDGVVFAGATGEGCALSMEEYQELIWFAQNYKDELLVTAAINSNNIEHALKLLEIANKADIGGVMVVTPFFNKPQKAGIVKYFDKIAQNTSMPIMVYNAPTRTGINLCDEVVYELSLISNVCALKDAATDPVRPLRLQSMGIKVDFAVLTGDDPTVMGYAVHGGMGVVSVASNFIPREMKIICDLCAKKDYDGAARMYKLYKPLFDILFIESNPVPIKALLNASGNCAMTVRLPLEAASSDSMSKIVDCFNRLNVGGVAN